MVSFVMKLAGINHKSSEAYLVRLKENLSFCIKIRARGADFRVEGLMWTRKCEQTREVPGASSPEKILSLLKKLEMHLKLTTIMRIPVH